VADDRAIYNTSYYAKKKIKINAQPNTRQITHAIHWWTTQANLFSFDSVSNKL